MYFIYKKHTSLSEKGKKAQSSVEKIIVAIHQVMQTVIFVLVEGMEKVLGLFGES